MGIVRELAKVIMFTQLWATPLMTAKVFDNQWYLLLFIVSIIGTAALFSHFEDITKVSSREGALQSLAEHMREVQKQTQHETTK